MKKIFPIFLLFFMPLVSGVFELSSLTVIIEAKENGKARIIENYRLYMSDNDTVNTYESAKGAINMVIDGWKNQTGIKEIRYHVSDVNVGSVIIKPQRREGCNPITGSCSAILMVEYETNSEIFILNKTKPRTTRYKLNRTPIIFEVSASDEIVLPEHTTLIIKIPVGSVITSVNPLPDEPSGLLLPSEDVTTLMWRGRTTLTKFELVFEMEDSLETEVIEFFKDKERQIREIIISQFLLIFILFLLIIVGIIGMKMRRR